MVNHKKQKSAAKKEKRRAQEDSRKRSKSVVFLEPGFDVMLTPDLRYLLIEGDDTVRPLKNETTYSRLRKLYFPLIFRFHIWCVSRTLYLTYLVY